jgi:glycosyltransferase involved in cell wall biosynthesis
VPEPLISVIIPAWNEEKNISDTLRALFVCVGLLEAKGGTCEVIVVDNASTDATVERASAFPVRVVREETRRIAAVRNAGAKAASGQYLVFIDADSHPSPDALVRIRETLVSGVYVGGGVRIKPERWTPRVILAYGALPVVVRLLGVSGGMIFTTRDVYDALGGFDETVYASEDLAFVLAMRDYGRKCGKKFANLSDVYIVTSTRKLRNMRWRDWLIFPRYFVDKNALRRRECCALWYDERYR